MERMVGRGGGREGKGSSAHVKMTIKEFLSPLRRAMLLMMLMLIMLSKMMTLQITQTIMTYERM